MFDHSISDFVEGVAAKYLSAVDAEPSRSNGHEIGGLPKAGFKQWLGTPNKHETYRFLSRQIYVSDQNDEPLICDGAVTWYDSRRNTENRSPEYRLYYYDTPVTNEISEGDFFLVAKLMDGVLTIKDNAELKEGCELKPGVLLMIFAPAGSTAERQLRWLFGLDDIEQQFTPGQLHSSRLVLPLRMMLENLKIEFNKPLSTDGAWTDKLLDEFGGKDFPTTAIFSDFARRSIANMTDPRGAPDATLLAWMDHEEMLFRLYERHLVQARLQAGFGKNGEDVDEFVSFSLSVHNRRKSRVGHAFEGHLDFLFRTHNLMFQQGRGKGNITENNSRPDFIFPSFAAYHDPQFPAARLLMLGAKTTCKDRWRQVISEAARIPLKHLVTLEAAISTLQTNEMMAHKVQLVIPTPIQSTYSARQQTGLIDVGGFIAEAKRILTD